MNSKAIWQMLPLACPRCLCALRVRDDALACTGEACRAIYPVFDGRPILIAEEYSLFTVDDVLAVKATTTPKPSRLGVLARRLLPELSHNLKAKVNYRKLTSLLLAESPTPQVLVVGGLTLGRGMEQIVRSARISLIETDIALSERVSLVCDAHNLPFADGSMDGVIVQAVLEHVVDPTRCAAEIHRVLRSGGLVYAETPFMQQVHGQQYDFMRFTALGHRRLFRDFEEISSGPIAGPGMVLGWSYKHLLQGFAQTQRGKNIATLIARLTGFWLKYLDFLVLDRRGAQDGSSGFYFLGRKCGSRLPDGQLLTLYRGIS